MIAETNAVARQFIEGGRIFFGDEIRAHAIPNDKNYVMSIRSRGRCHYRDGLTRQSCDYDQNEFSQDGFQLARSSVEERKLSSQANATDLSFAEYSHRIEKF